MESFATQWLITYFTRLTSFPLVYELLEIIIYERDQLLVLYFVIALLQLHKG